MERQTLSATLSPGPQLARRALPVVKLLTGLRRLRDIPLTWLKPRECLWSLALKVCTESSPRSDAQVLSGSMRRMSRESPAISERGQPADYRGGLSRWGRQTCRSQIGEQTSGSQQALIKLCHGNRHTRLLLIELCPALPALLRCGLRPQWHNPGHGDSQDQAPQQPHFPSCLHLRWSLSERGGGRGSPGRLPDATSPSWQLLKKTKHECHRLFVFVKSLLNLLRYCFLAAFFGHETCGILSLLPGIEPTPPALAGEVQTTRQPQKSLSAIVLIFSSTKHPQPHNQN